MVCYVDSFTLLYVNVQTSQETLVGLHGLLWGLLYFFICRWFHTSPETHLRASTACYRYSLIFMCRCSYLTETCLWAFTASYGFSFTFFYIQMFLPERKHLWATTACYGDSFALLCVDVHTLQKHSSGSPLPVTEIALLSYMQIMSIPQRKHICGPIIGIAPYSLLAFSGICGIIYQNISILIVNQHQNIKCAL
jgi:hypothetical protein